MKRLVLIPAIVLLAMTFLSAQENDDCFICHDDNELTMEKRGREISLYTDPEAFSHSVHADVNCVECHVGFDPDEEPHKENITPVNCADCHDDAVADVNYGAHSGSVDCADCHSDVHKPQKASVLQAQCAQCHDDVAEEFAGSIHKTHKDGALCADCHNTHKIVTASSETCIDCHSGHEPKTAEGEDQKDFILSFETSIHADMLDCADCHGSHEIVGIDNPASPVSETRVTETCVDCHVDVGDTYMASEHGKLFEEGYEFAPGCTDCHGEHKILSSQDERSAMSRQNEVEVCLSCHLDKPEVSERMTHSSGFIKAYETSVHGKEFKAGNPDAPVCSDCHGAHGAMKASAEQSPVNKFNIASTCSNCHGEITKEFNQSIHGQALADGVEDAATCTDCHGEHGIIETASADAPVAPTNVSQQVCGPCHSSVRMAEKFGLPSQNLGTYLDSYHGLAVRFGEVEAANCASCHGVHDILPSSDPQSMIHKANLASTCGSCHPGANENFAKGKVHITGEQDEDALIYWISSIYIFLIVATVGAMGAHNLLDYFRKMKVRYRKRYYEPEYIPIEKKTTHYERMTIEARLQHILLAVSFILLVITGFMLKFPDAWWVKWTRAVTGDWLFDLRGLVHRIAAVVMVIASIWHTYYIAFTERGRQFIKDMMFRIQDFKDMWQQLLYNLGKSKTHPKYDRFNYYEKVEYWALIWGTIVMTVSGFILWFENQSMAWFSKLFVDVAEAIHYYEAWLAFLAIVVWHFYYVIFNPDVYPLNFTWITGKVTEEEMEREHPLELEKIKKEEQLHDEEGDEEAK